MLTQYENIWKSFIRPTRQTYSEFDFGPAVQQFKNQRVFRSDFDFKNREGKNIKCSLFEPVILSGSLINAAPPQSNKFPCVVYCHGNSGCRLDSISYLEHLISRGIGMFAFDFLGSGLSDGEYVTLGFKEQYDLQDIITYLRTIPKITQIGLFGRSMGAVTCLLYTSMDSQFSGLVLDSPFSNLKLLAMEIARSKISLPNFLLEGLLKILNNSIEERAGFRLEQVDPISVVKDINIPAVFVTSSEDKLVKSEHSQKLQELYKGSSQIKYIFGAHNGERDYNYRKFIADFFQEQFGKHILSNQQQVQQKSNNPNETLNSFIQLNLNQKYQQSDISKEEAQLKQVDSLESKLVKKEENFKTLKTFHQKSVSISTIPKITEKIQDQKMEQRINNIQELKPILRQINKDTNRSSSEANRVINSPQSQNLNQNLLFAPPLPPKTQKNQVSDIQQLKNEQVMNKLQLQKLFQKNERNGIQMDEQQNNQKPQEKVIINHNEYILQVAENKDLFTHRKESTTLSINDEFQECQDQQIIPHNQNYLGLIIESGKNEKPNTGTIQKNDQSQNQSSQTLSSYQLEDFHNFSRANPKCELFPKSFLTQSNSSNSVTSTDTHNNRVECSATPTIQNITYKHNRELNQQNKFIEINTHQKNSQKIENANFDTERYQTLPNLQILNEQLPISQLSPNQNFKLNKDNFQTNSQRVETPCLSNSCNKPPKYTYLSTLSQIAKNGMNQYRKEDNFDKSKDKPSSQKSDNFLNGMNEGSNINNFDQISSYKLNIDLSQKNSIPLNQSGNSTPVAPRVSNIINNLMSNSTNQQLPYGNSQTGALKINEYGSSSMPSITLPPFIEAQTKQQNFSLFGEACNQLINDRNGNCSFNNETQSVIQNLQTITESSESPLRKDKKTNQLNKYSARESSLPLPPKSSQNSFILNPIKIQNNNLTPSVFEVIDKSKYSYVPLKTTISSQTCKQNWQLPPRYEKPPNLASNSVAKIEVLNQQMQNSNSEQSYSVQYSKPKYHQNFAGQKPQSVDLSSIQKNFIKPSLYKGQLTDSGSQQISDFNSNKVSGVINYSIKSQNILKNMEENIPFELKKGDQFNMPSSIKSKSQSAFVPQMLNHKKLFPSSKLAQSQQSNQTNSPLYIQKQQETMMEQLRNNSNSSKMQLNKQLNMMEDKIKTLEKGNIINSQQYLLKDEDISNSQKISQILSFHKPQVARVTDVKQIHGNHLSQFDYVIPIFQTSNSDNDNNKNITNIKSTSAYSSPLNVCELNQNIILTCSKPPILNAKESPYSISTLFALPSTSSNIEKQRSQNQVSQI